ncbi:MAG: sulfate ABC transporter ATP-binding protein [Planctomycetaceae bacterium]|jgi:sulfate transport system ATP-binding protein|nr:sulfate ABC transporter ATP-binding protein [Planctomycetaceae bacterium]
MSIEARHITKRFGEFTALDDVSLTVCSGELVALLGPSGSGKTTLLRIIAGLDAPSEPGGVILFSGENISSRRVGDRGVGFVFQHYALFRHMTVFENIAFGLRVRPRKTRPSGAVIQAKVSELLNLVQLSQFSGRYPHQLSGGQRQRVALARALAVEPQMLLLDEPFGALDAKVRVELRAWLRRLHDEIHLTSVFVTHDQDEALELADRVAVMNAGRIEQFGTPDQVFHEPATEFVMNFLGSVNQFHGRYEKGQVCIGQHRFELPETVFRPAEVTPVFVRPHELTVTAAPIEGQLSLQANIRNVHSAGSHVRVELFTETQDTLFAELTHQERKNLNLTVGGTVYVTPRNLRIFSGESFHLKAE